VTVKYTFKNEKQMKENSIITLFLLFFSLQNFAQPINIKVVCSQDSSPVDYATFLLHPNNEVYISNDNGLISIERYLFYDCDSITGSHIGYGLFTINPKKIQIFVDTITINIAKKHFDIDPLVVKPERLRTIVANMLDKWDNNRVKRYRNSIGVFSTIVKEKDSIYYAFVSDAVGFWGDNDPGFYSKSGLDTNTPHFGIIPLGTYTNKGFKTLNLGHSGVEVLTSIQRSEDLALAEKFIFNHGPISKKFKRYYYYELDSIYWDEHNSKHYSISFRSKSKALKKNILCGGGQIVLDSDYNLKKVKLLNPKFPLIYPHNGIHYRKKDSGFVQVINLSFVNSNDTIYPGNLMVESKYSNGRFESARYSPSSIISPLEFSKQPPTVVFNILSSFFGSPMLYPPKHTSTKALSEASRVSEIYGIKFIPVENPTRLSVVKSSFPDQEIKYNEIYKQIIDILWQKQLEY
jgi:hypothetical protein